MVCDGVATIGSRKAQKGATIAGASVMSEPHVVKYINPLYRSDTQDSVRYLSEWIFFIHPQVSVWCLRRYRLPSGAGSGVDMKTNELLVELVIISLIMAAVLALIVLAVKP